jgi:hypothetical protein
MSKNYTTGIPATERTDASGPPIRLALRPKEAAVAIGISERKLWEITADRTSGIPHTRFGKVILYPVRELADWLTERASGGVR